MTFTTVNPAAKAARDAVPSPEATAPEKPWALLPGRCCRASGQEGGARAGWLQCLRRTLRRRLQTAAATAVRARYHNAGQSCVCAKRFIVEAPVAHQLVDAFVASVRQLTLGDPRQPGTTVGPMARDDLGGEGIRQDVEYSVAEGADLVLGGKPLPGGTTSSPPC